MSRPYGYDEGYQDGYEAYKAEHQEDYEELALECRKLTSENAKLKEAIQACVDDDFNSNALMIELTALVKPGM